MLCSFMLLDPELLRSFKIYLKLEQSSFMLKHLSQSTSIPRLAWTMVRPTSRAWSRLRLKRSMHTTPCGQATSMVTAMLTQKSSPTSSRPRDGWKETSEAPIQSNIEATTEEEESKEKTWNTWKPSYWVHEYVIRLHLHGTSWVTNPKELLDSTVINGKFSRPGDKTCATNLGTGKPVILLDVVLIINSIQECRSDGNHIQSGALSAPLMPHPDLPGLNIQWLMWLFHCSYTSTHDSLVLSAYIILCHELKVHALIHQCSK